MWIVYYTIGECSRDSHRESGLVDFDDREKAERFIGQLVVGELKGQDRPVQTTLIQGEFVDEDPEHPG